MIWATSLFHIQNVLIWEVFCQKPMILEWLISVQNVLIWEEKKRKKILCMIPQRNQIGTVFFPPANDSWSHFWLLLSSVTGSFARNKKSKIWKTWSLRLNWTPGAAAASSSLKVSWVCFQMDFVAMGLLQMGCCCCCNGVLLKWILLQWVVVWNGFWCNEILLQMGCSCCNGFYCEMGCCCC